ncbi:MAG TPA: glycosyltransferase family 39 protein [Vicinamibacteria bacterium]|nr:glycosyltransferase family 39 protein [Vicinamibacteria bacterium]
MRTNRLPLYAIIGASLVLNVTAIWWGLPSLHGWAPDELQPSVILSGIDVRFSGDWHQPAYPPLPYYVLALAYLPALALDFADPRNVEHATLLIAIGRAISLGMGVGILLVVHALGRELLDSTAALFAAAIAALNVPFVYYAKTANLDVPAAFWVLLSLYFFVRATRTEATRDLFAFAATAALAMLTKDQAFAFYVLPVGYFFYRRHRENRRILDRSVVLSFALGLGLFLGLHNVFFNFQGFVHHFQEILWARGHYGTFPSGVDAQFAILTQTFKHITFSLGWPLTIACLLGVSLAIQRRSRAMWLLLAAVSYYGFFIAPVLSTWLRYALPLGFLLAPFGGLLISEVWRRSTRYRIGAAAVFAFALARAASVDALLLQDSRYSAEAWLRQQVKPDDVVGYVGPEYYLPRLHPFRAKRLRPTLSVLSRSSPDYLVVNADFAERFDTGSRERELFEDLSAGRAGYALVFEHQTEPRWVLLDFDGILANLGKLNPLIRVYQRAD